MDNSFNLAKTELIDGIGKLSLFIHKKSGGKAVCIDNDDQNGVFSLCFNTKPEDNTGIPHVLEHCVLCGSEKFPFKDPFNMLYTTTSNTYLNAITFPHKTVFPVASLSEQALWLMARVYCDGVFNPLVYKNKGIFLQEGGFFDGSKIQGIVYNEMLGFYDNIENAVEQKLIRDFLPFVSAGLPHHIPDISYEKMLEYHQKHYTPENCFAYIYGNFDKSKYLNLLDEYFCKFRQKQQPEPTTQTIRNLQFRQVYTNKHEKFTMAVIPLCSTNDYLKTLACNIVTDSLKKALPDLKISFNDEGETAYARICTYNMDMLNLKQHIEQSVQSLKITRADIEKQIFCIKNADFGYKPKGLYYNLRLMYSGLNFSSLDFTDIFREINKLDFRKITDLFVNNGIYGENHYKIDRSKSYAITNPQPLIEYQNSKDNIKAEIPPLPVIFPDEAITDKNLTFVPIESKEIIYLTLAFCLDVPRNVLRHIGILQQNYGTALPDFKVDFRDLGRPCFVITAGFFAKNWHSDVIELNKVFNYKQDNYRQKIFETPQIYTNLLALSGVEKNAFVLNSASGYYFRADEADLTKAQQAVFNKNNLFAAVCCHNCNKKTATKVLSKLKLSSSSMDVGNIPFEENYATEIIRNYFNINTISMAFKPKSSYTAAFVAAEMLKNGYLWENVRNKGAYGCDCFVTPSGNVCLNSFKDPNFDITIQAFKGIFEHLNTIDITSEDLHCIKISCLNMIDRPASNAQKGLNAIKEMFAPDLKNIRNRIINITAEDVKCAFNGVDAVNIAAFKAD